MDCFQSRSATTVVETIFGILPAQCARIATQPLQIIVYRLR
jgi:hypothetical protein